MSRRVVTMLVGVVLLLALGLSGAMLPVPYAALGPGPTVNTLGRIGDERVIRVTGGDYEPVDYEGHLQLTTVGVQDELNLFNALKGWLDGGVSVVPREQVYPPGKTEEEVNEQNRQEIIESQNFAEAAALKELGYPLEAVVHSVDSDSPSADRLTEGDVLTSLNGQDVSPDTLIGHLTDIDPGTTVDVGFTRDGQERTTRVTTVEAEKRDGAALGITVESRRVAPFEISFDVGNIGGPSAGLMFALGIIEKIGDEDLTHGEFIAGTGTIDREGNVGPIGGIGLKLMGAQRDGATVFLVPAENCSEALDDPPDGLRLIRVETLDGALESLDELADGGDPPGC